MFEEKIIATPSSCGSLRPVRVICYHRTRRGRCEFVRSHCRSRKGQHNSLAVTAQRLSHPRPQSTEQDAAAG